VISCRIPDNNPADEGYTPGVLGAPDSISYSLGKSGFIALDMGDTIHNGPGDDLKVIEGDTTEEGFFCYASNKMDGPWMILGNGTGTTSFDLSAGSLDGARYVMITDDGDGITTGADIGFDLDAVQILTLPLSADFLASDTVIVEGSSVNFTDSSSGSPVSWYWIFQGGTPEMSDLKNPSGIRYDSAGIYDVILIISNGLSFSTLKKSAYINVSSANSVADINADQDVRVSPNPSDGRISLKIDSFIGGTFSIYSNLGELLLGETINTNNFTSEINFTGKPSGIYLLRVSSPYKSVSKKIVIF
jgi:PKD repeat protein